MATLSHQPRVAATKMAAVCSHSGLGAPLPSEGEQAPDSFASESTAAGSGSSRGSSRSPSLSGGAEDSPRSTSSSDTDSTASLSYPLADGPSEKDAAQEEEVRNEILYDKYYHALDMEGVSDELLWSWAEAEAVLLGSHHPLHRQPTDGVPLLDNIPQQARSLCLQLMRNTIVAAGLDLEVWFDAASLLDAYLDRSVCRVDDLPSVCAVLLRMMWKEHTPKGSFLPNFDRVLPLFSHCLVSWGFMEPRQTQPGIDHEALFALEHRILDALDWRVNLPSLGKWTKAMCRRLAIFAEPEQKDAVAAISRECAQQVQLLTVAMGLSPQFPPQRVARGLVVLRCSRARLSPRTIDAPSTAPSSQSSPSAVPADFVTYLQKFECVMGATPEMLVADCRLAGQALEMLGARGAFQPQPQPPARQDSSI